jgi:hypothetical protein
MLADGRTRASEFIALREMRRRSAGRFDIHLYIRVYLRANAVAVSANVAGGGIALLRAPQELT